MVNDSRYYRALESVSIASALSTAASGVLLKIEAGIREKQGAEGAEQQAPKARVSRGRWRRGGRSSLGGGSPSPTD